MANYNGQKRPNKKRKGKGKSKDSREYKGAGRPDYDSSSDPRMGRNRGDALKNASNDVSWYSKYPELLAAAGQLPYPWRPGMRLPMEVRNGITYTYRLPGVMDIRWVPSVGQSNDVTSPISIASKEIYARVRAAFSGSLEADPPDFIMYLMALDSIYSYIGSLKRLYRIVNAYTPQNLAIPQVLITAMFRDIRSTNPSDRTNFPKLLMQLQRDKMKLFGAINELIHMTEKFRCPALMDIFNRHYWLNDNVYADANSANSQLYMFVEDYFLKFDMITTTSGVEVGGLVYTSAPSVLSGNDDPVGELFQFGKRLIDALAESDDAYTISGYLMRAFEGVPTFTVDLLSYDERLELKYDEEVLMQIENTVALPDKGVTEAAINNSKWDISQNPKTNVVLSTPMVEYAASNTSMWYLSYQNVNLLNNIRSDMPTVADTVIATRMKSWLTQRPGSTTIFDVHCATECVIAIELVDQPDAKELLEQYRSIHTTANASADSHRWLQLFMYDWNPIMYYNQYNDTTKTPGPITPVWDIHNVTVLDKTALEQLNKVCLYSELNAFNI